MNGEDGNITIILDYFKNSTLSNSERENSNGVTLGTANHEAARRFRLPLLARLSRALHCQRWNTCRPDGPANPPADRRLRAPARPDRMRASVRVRLRPVQPDHAGSGAHRSAGAGTPGTRQQRHRGLHRDRRTAQQFACAGRAHAARRDGRDDRAGDSSEQSVPGCDGTSRSVATAPSMPARVTWHIQTDNLRGVLGLRGEIERLELGSLGAACAQRVRAERRSLAMGWVRTDFLQTARSTPGATTRSARPSIRRR